MCLFVGENGILHSSCNSMLMYRMERERMELMAQGEKLDGKIREIEARMDHRRV